MVCITDDFRWYDIIIGTYQSAKTSEVSSRENGMTSTDISTKIPNMKFLNGPTVRTRHGVFYTADGKKMFEKPNKNPDASAFRERLNEILTHNSVPQLIFRCFSTLNQTGATDGNRVVIRRPVGLLGFAHDRTRCRNIRTANGPVKKMYSLNTVRRSGTRRRGVHTDPRTVENVDILQCEKSTKFSKLIFVKKKKK